FDYASLVQRNNDWVVLRYSGVLLMKADALLRLGGYEAEALELVNAIRRNRNAAELANIKMDILIKEMSNEFYCKCLSRHDLIRFGKFLDPRQEKPQVSDVKYLLYHIPSQQLAVNANLTKNEGYQ